MLLAFPDDKGSGGKKHLVFSLASCKMSSRSLVSFPAADDTSGGFIPLPFSSILLYLCTFHCPFLYFSPPFNFPAFSLHYSTPFFPSSSPLSSSFSLVPPTPPLFFRLILQLPSLSSSFKLCSFSF